MIQLLTAKRENYESIFDFWNRLAKLATECKLDNKTATEIVNSLIVAVFTIAADDEEIGKVKPKSNDTIELKMKLNGKPLSVILELEARYS